jgi:Lipocalin-like domain
MPKVTLLLGLFLAMTTTSPAASQTEDADRKALVGVWRLVSITADGQVNPLRGGRPTGYIFYTASGEMGAMIQPEREPVAMAGKEPSPEEARAALKGYTAYFGTYSIDERAKVITHHRKGSVQPGYEADVVRHYRFEAGDRLVLGNPATKSQLIWERIR